MLTSSSFGQLWSSSRCHRCRQSEASCAKRLSSFVAWSHLKSWTSCCSSVSEFLHTRNMVNQWNTMESSHIQPHRSRIQTFRTKRHLNDNNPNKPLTHHDPSFMHSFQSYKHWLPMFARLSMVIQCCICPESAAHLMLSHLLLIESLLHLLRAIREAGNEWQGLSI